MRARKSELARAVLANPKAAKLFRAFVAGNPVVIPLRRADGLQVNLVPVFVPIPMRNAMITPLPSDDVACVSNSARSQKPDAYQQLIDGKWVGRSYFVAYGWSDTISPNCRALYAEPSVGPSRNANTE